MSGRDDSVEMQKDSFDSDGQGGVIVMDFNSNKQRKVRGAHFI